jgi:hypothetical protein
MATSEQLEREAEKTRAKIVESLDELRERMTPGQFVDQAFDFARDGRAGQFVRNLGRQTVENPLPIALIGAGIGWLMIGGRGPRRDGRAAVSDASGANSGASRDVARTGQELKDRTAATVSGLTEGVKETTHDWSGRAQETASDIADRARGMASSAYDQGAGAYEATADALGRSASAVSRSASSVGSSATSSASSLVQFLKDEPLVLAAIGVALGAAIGAALPASETEDRLMGDTSDALKQGAAEAAQEQWEKGKKVAEAAADKAWGGAKQEAEAQGLTSERPLSGTRETDEKTEVQPSLVPTEQDIAAERMADATEREQRPGV